jgi:hypothetical protein
MPTDLTEVSSILQVGNKNEKCGSCLVRNTFLCGRDIVFCSFPFAEHIEDIALAQRREKHHL